jgi:histidine ammonia-lyase
MMDGPFMLEPGRLSLADLRGLWQKPTAIELGEDAWSRIDVAQQTVTDIVDSGQTVYGINTGFGLLAATRIDDDQLQVLQQNLVLSHSTGVGPDLADDLVRLVLILKVSSLSQGHSGVARATVSALLELLSHQAYPSIPAQGSVGASGDLAPLAHLSAALLGHGFISYLGERLPAAEVLDRIGLKPLKLGPKEGLALLNGTQVSCAMALVGLFRAEQVFAGALCAGAMSVDAVQGSDTPFDPRIHAVRGHTGQVSVARVLRKMLSGSEIRASHVDCNRVQDPYSLRC